MTKLLKESEVKLILKEMSNEFDVQRAEIDRIKKKYNIESSVYFDRLEEFYRNRNESVFASRVESKKESLELYKKLNTPREKVYSEIIYERDVNNDLSFLLMQHEFDFEEKGTSYLDRLVRILYDEIDFYNSNNDNTFDYWNLDDYSNIHYKLMGVKSEEAIYEIIKSINNSPVTYGASISEVAFDLVDKLIKRDLKNKKESGYKKMNR